MPNVNCQDHVKAMSPLQYEFWQSNMTDCPDLDLKQQIFDGLDHGVDIGCNGPDSGHISDNWPSASEFHDDVSKFISQNLLSGRVVGPWISPPCCFTSWCISER